MGATGKQANQKVAFGKYYESLPYIKVKEVGYAPSIDRSIRLVLTVSSED